MNNIAIEEQTTATPQEQLEKATMADLAENTPATKPAPKRRWDIPASFLPEVKRLSRASTEAQVRYQCADSRFDAAVKAGDAEKALEEKFECQRLAANGKTTQNALWDELRRACPDMPKATNGFTLDSSEWYVEAPHSRSFDAMASFSFAGSDEN